MPDDMADGEEPSLPKKMPGQGNCPPGYRPGTYAGQSPGSSGCLPIGPGVPAGGWKAARPGGGPGYPPSFDQARSAIYDAPFGDPGAANYGTSYADWIRRLAGR